MTTATALTNQQRVACEETYKDVEKLIYQVAWLFQKKFGGDIDDLIADANSHYMRAYTAQTFDSRKSKFSTWVRNIVWRGLVNERNTAYFRLRTDDHDMDQRTAKTSVSVLGDLLEDMSADAPAVAKIVLSMPDDLYDAVEAKGGQARNIRSVLHDYLESLGWAADRVTESFEEIAAAIAR